ncbi:MAG TPA: hypothetical protein VGK70_15205 [Thermoanaerobaculia bacterium]
MAGVEAAPPSGRPGTGVLLTGWRRSTRQCPAALYVVVLSAGAEGGHELQRYYFRVVRP